MDERNDQETTLPGGGDSFADLLRAIRGGDRDARDALYRRLLPALRRWASRRLPIYVRDLVDTDDLTQDAMMQTLGRVDDLELDKRGMVAYLRKVVLNRIRDEIRRSARRPAADPSSFDGTGADAPSPLEQAIGLEAVARYESALDTLEVRERDALILRIEMGYSYPEIAEALDWNSANAARMAVTRAVGRLAAAMSHGRD